METSDHYLTLGLDRRCSEEQVRTAYRVLAKLHHPDVNGGAPESVSRTQALNAAYEVLSDPERRAAYDRELARAKPAEARGARRGGKNVAQDVSLRIEDFFRGVRLEVRVNDPGNPEGPESYELLVPPGSAPGSRLRLARGGYFVGGFVQVRLKVLAGFRFKARGSDLRCDLRVKPERVRVGGTEMVPGPTGGLVRVEIPRGVGRDEVLRVPGEGLPKGRGGRGDLLVRVRYQPAVKVRKRGPA